MRAPGSPESTSCKSRMILDIDLLRALASRAQHRSTVARQLSIPKLLSIGIYGKLVFCASSWDARREKDLGLSLGRLFFVKHVAIHKKE
jgi:hypothetical protein